MVKNELTPYLSTFIDVDAAGFIPVNQQAVENLDCRGSVRLSTFATALLPPSPFHFLRKKDKSERW